MLKRFNNVWSLPSGRAIMDQTLSGYKLLQFYCIWCSADLALFKCCCLRSDPLWFMRASVCIRPLCYHTWAGWDGVKNFFLATHTGLCFGFVTKTLLITGQYCSSCWTVIAKSQGFLFVSPLDPIPPHRWIAEGGQETGRYGLNWLKGYSMPQNVMLSNKISARRREFEFLASKMSAIQKLTEHGLPMGGVEHFVLIWFLNYLLSFLPLLHKLSLPWPPSLLAFALPIFSLLPCRGRDGEWANNSAVVCWPGMLCHHDFMGLSHRL